LEIVLLIVVEEENMKKFISILTAIIFFFTVSSLAYGGDESVESARESERIMILSAVLIAVTTLLVVVGIKATRSSNAKSGATVIFNEATCNHGERSNLEILAHLYELSVGEVIDTISMMVADGEIDMANALADDEAAQEALKRLHQTLEAYSQSKGKDLQVRLETLKKKFQTEFPTLFEKNQTEEKTQLPTTLEMADFYRNFFKEVKAAAK
jgi:hypothetical protein